jgi:hypothetical protein
MRNKWFNKEIRRLCLAVLVLSFAVLEFAKMYEEPKSFSLNDKSQELVERKILAKIDTERLLAEDRARGKDAQRPGPYRFAFATDVTLTLSNSGTWQTLADGRLWRLRIQSPGAKNLNLGITRFAMPDGAKLWIYDPGHKHVEGPYTSRDRSHRGSLWTPIIEGDEIVIEVFVPAGVSQPVVKISRVNRGYRGLEKLGIFGNSEGTCNIDVVCPAGNPWQNQISAVAAYTINGTAACTGTLLNNTALDFTPYFLSANHCGVSSSNDDTVVVYWNFESATCGTHGPGSLADNQTGSIFRASYATSDFLLIQLSDLPDPSFNVFHAGWDATGTTPSSTVCFHHPSADVKAISFSNTAPDTTAYLSNTYNASGSFWRVVWDSGVTEGGSSGSGLFETTNGRCIGQLKGGYSSCLATSSPDWYGRLSESWIGGGTDATGLRHWLDPGNTGVMFLDGDPHVTTANGIHYDFQGGGEFVVLRDANGLEVQTRQAPIATTFNPGADPYDGLATCVSLNTAVAVRVGDHRITYEPNFSGVPDPSGLQLRLDGVLSTLDAAGRDLGNGARIAPTSAPGGLKIDYRGSVIIVTPGWWSSQSKWYLNVDIVYAPVVDGIMGGAPGTFRTPTTKGLMGAIAPGNWLPALPNGTSMGPMPNSLHQRYVDLYQRFGEAWRVTSATSLFDYAPGTSTATFTVRGWPPENPPCVIAGMPAVKPVELAVAERACRKVTGNKRYADCVFDVSVTGELGFADTYLASQQVLAGLNPPPPRPGKLATFMDFGASIPQGTFANAFDTGFSFNIGLEHMLTHNVSTEGIFGYHRFPGKITGSVKIYQFSANVKVYFRLLPSKLRPFVNGGVGTYAFSPGSTDFGANAGCGVLYELSPRFGMQGSYNFHTVKTPNEATKFSTVQGGIRIVF